jgi:RNA polymerase sigma-70 factor, ECF subfamily
MRAPEADADAELMLRFREGDEAAFVRLVESHRKRVLNLAYRFLGDRAEAEDIAQEVFVRVYQARDRYRPDARFSTWLHQIAVNLCLNEARRRRRRPLWPWSGSDDEGLAIPDPADSPEDELETQALGEAVRRALAALPEKQRMAVILHRYEGLSYEAIAQVLGCSVGAVDGLLSRAKGTLRGSLAPYILAEPPQTSAATGVTISEGSKIR